MADVFVSYARTDKELVTPLIAAIEREGWTVWWDPEIVPGQEFDDQITAELAAARAVVVVWTPTSVASRWVRGEAREAAERGILVPTRLQGAKLPLDVRAIHTIDLDGWGCDAESASCRELLRALSTMIARGPAGAAPAPQSGTQASQAAAAPGLSICVLPFSNMSGEQEQEYFSDGISEDIITDLSKVSALAVVARNTAFTLKGKHVDVAQVARQFRVSHVLEGSVRKAGQRVRISAQLIDGATGSHVWAERYDRDLNDIFSLQDEISQAIVSALKLKLMPGERKAIEQRGTSSADAYRLLLMARQQYQSGGMYDMKRLRTVLRICERAVETDPNYARAWALMATAQRLGVYFGSDGPNGLAAAERAIALDANLAEAHAALAGVHASADSYDAALSEIDVALRLDPESWDVNREAARLYYRLRRYPEAIKHFERAAASIDADWSSCSMLISCHAATGDRDQARLAAKRTLAIAETLAATESGDGAVMASAVSALAYLGQTERAREWTERAVLLDPDNMNMLYNLACTMVTDVRDHELALDLLERFLASVGSEFLAWTKSDPDLDAIRKHPRYAAMVAAAESRLGGA